MESLIEYCGEVEDEQYVSFSKQKTRWRNYKRLLSSLLSSLYVTVQANSLQVCSPAAFQTREAQNQWLLPHDGILRWWDAVEKRITEAGIHFLALDDLNNMYWYFYYYFYYFLCIWNFCLCWFWMLLLTSIVWGVYDLSLYENLVILYAALGDDIIVVVIWVHSKYVERNQR